MRLPSPRRSGTGAVSNVRRRLSVATSISAIACEPTSAAYSVRRSGDTTMLWGSMPTSMRAAVSPDAASTTNKVLEPAWLTNTRSSAGAAGSDRGSSDPQDKSPAAAKAMLASLLACLAVESIATKRRTGLIQLATLVDPEPLGGADRGANAALPAQIETQRVHVCWPVC